MKFIRGPKSRVDEVRDFDPGLLNDFQDLDEVRDSMEEVKVPDFSRPQALIMDLGVIIPDDPLDVGLPEVKRLIARVATDYRVLGGYRSECIGIKTEWASLRTRYGYLIKQAQGNLKATNEYATLKNADARTTFLASVVSDYSFIDVLIDQAIQRCNDFIDVCRLKGKELDFCASGLGNQLKIITLQVHLKQIKPEDIE